MSEEPDLYKNAEKKKVKPMLKSKKKYINIVISEIYGHSLLLFLCV